MKQPKKQYDTDKEWLDTREAGAFLAEILRITRKQSRPMIRTLKRDEKIGLFSRSSIEARFRRQREIIGMSETEPAKSWTPDFSAATGYMYGPPVEIPHQTERYRHQDPGDDGIPPWE